MHVLVTNDDGVEARGLHVLARAMAEVGHKVTVVAPGGECSGTAAGIGRLHRAGPIAWTEVDWPDLPDTPVHSLDALPAAAVYAGCLGAFGPVPDLVASGVNPGLNYGHLVLHSGTVGAALTAAALGVPSLAVSLAWRQDDEWHWDTAGALAAAAADWVAEPDTPPRVLNLNSPNCPLDDVIGVREARLARFGERWKTATQPGELVLEYDGHGIEPEPDTDYALVREGYATVTRLRGVEGAPAGTAADAIATTLFGHESGL